MVGRLAKTLAKMAAKNRSSSGPVGDALLGRELAPRLSSVRGGGQTTAKAPWTRRDPEMQREVDALVSEGAMSGRLHPFYIAHYTPYQLALAKKINEQLRSFRPRRLPTWLSKGDVSAFPFGVDVGSGYGRMSKLDMGRLASSRSMNPARPDTPSLGDRVVNKMLAPFNVTSSPRNYVDDIALTGTPIGRGAGRKGRSPAVIFGYGEALPPVRLFPAAFHAQAPRLSTGMRSTDLRLAPSRFYQFTGRGGLPSDTKLDMQELIKTENRFLDSLLPDTSTPSWGSMFTDRNPYS